MLHNKVSPREVRLANFHLAVEEDSIHDDDYDYDEVAVVVEEDKIERRRERSPPVAVAVAVAGSIHDNIHDDVDLLAVLVLVHTGDDREADLHSLY